MKKILMAAVCAAFLLSGCAKGTGDSASVTTEVPEVEETGVSFPEISAKELSAVYNPLASYICSFLAYEDQVYTSSHAYTVTDLEKLSAQDVLGEEIASVAGNHGVYWSTDGEDLAEVTYEGTLYQVKGYDESFRVAIYYEAGEPATETTYCVKIFDHLNGITLHDGSELFEDLLHLSDAASVTGTAGQHTETIDLTGNAVVEEVLTAICESTELTSLEDTETEWDADEAYTLSFSDANGITTDIMLYEDGSAVMRFHGAEGVVVKIDEGIYKKLPYQGNQLFESVDVEKVEQIVYYAFDETETYLTDPEAIADILNILWDGTYTRIPEAEYIEGNYTLALDMENGDTVQFGVSGTVLVTEDGQFACEDETDLDRIMQYFE